MSGKLQAPNTKLQALKDLSEGKPLLRRGEVLRICQGVGISERKARGLIEGKGAALQRNALGYFSRAQLAEVLSDLISEPKANAS